MEDEEDPPSLSFHALTASTMLMPWLILSLRKRLYSLGLRFSFFAGFILPSCAILLSMFSCCFLRASFRPRMLSLSSLAREAWLSQWPLAWSLREKCDSSLVLPAVTS